MRFQSTRPAWGATVQIPQREERLLYFNPHAPRGARHGGSVPAGVAMAFQSTRPAWGATLDAGQAVGALIISIHTPRVGRDGIRQFPSR